MVVAAMSPGSFAGWATVVVLVALVVMLLRGGIPGAVAELRAANEVLTKRVHNLNDEKRDLEKQVAVLEGRTDVAIALKPLADSIHAHDDAARVWMDEHNRRADERHTAILGVLELIAARLGKENPDAD